MTRLWRFVLIGWVGVLVGDWYVSVMFGSFRCLLMCVLGDLERYVGRAVVRGVLGSLVRWFVGSLVRRFVGSLVRWFVGSLVRWVVGSLDRWCVW